LMSPTSRYETKGKHQNQNPQNNNNPKFCQVLETRNRRSKAHKSTHTTWSRKSSANHPTNRARARPLPPPPSLSLLRFVSTPRFSFFP
jgi:hypothetical protein